MKRITATVNNEKPSKNPSTTNLPSSSTSSSLNTNVNINGLHYPKTSYIPPSKITLNRVSTVVSIPKANYNQQQSSKPSSLPKPTSTATVISSTSTSRTSTATTTTTNKLNITEKKSSTVDTSKNIDHHHSRPARVHFNKKIFNEDIRPVLKLNEQQQQKSLIPRYPTSSGLASQQPAQNKTIKRLLQEDLEISNHANKTPPKIIRYKSKFHNLAEHNKNLDLERERKDKERRLSSKFYDPQEVKSFIEKQRELNRLIKEREEEEKKQEQERVKRRVDLLNRKCRTIVKNCNKKAIISPTKTKSKISQAQAQFQIVKQRPVTSTTTTTISSISTEKDKVQAGDLFTEAQNAKLYQSQECQDKGQELQLLKEKKKSPKSSDENENVDSSHLVHQFQKIVEKECMKILNNCTILEPTAIPAARKKRKPSTNSECFEIEPNRKRLKDFLSPHKDKQDQDKISPKKVDHPINTETESLQYIGLEYKEISKANSPLKKIDKKLSNEVSPTKSKHHSDYKGIITNSNLVNEFQANVEKECMEILNNCNLNVFEDASVSKINHESKLKTNTSTSIEKNMGPTLKKSPKKSKSDNKFDLERADFKKLKEVLLSPPSAPSKYHHKSSIPLKFTSEMDAIRNLFPAKECESSQSNIKIKSAKSTPKVFMSTKAILKEKFENDDNDKNNNAPSSITIPTPKQMIRNEFDGNHNQEQQILNHFRNENFEDSNRNRSMTISKVALLKNAMLRNDTTTAVSNKIPTNIFAELKKCQRESMRATSSCAKLISELKARGYETNEMIPEREQDGQDKQTNKEYSSTSDKNANVSVKSLKSRSSLSHSSASVSAISIEKEFKEKAKEDSLSESNYEAVSLSQHSIRESIDEYSLDFESERICTETTRHSNSTSIFPLSNEMDNDKVEEHQNQLDKSSNASKIEGENFSTNENSRIDSEINEEEFESVSSSRDVKDKVHLSAEEKEKSSSSNDGILNKYNQKFSYQTQTPEKSQSESEKSSAPPTKLQLFDEESINEELEISKNESIAEEFEEGNSQDFQSVSEHHFSASNIPSIKTTTSQEQEVNEGKNDDLKEIFSSHDNSRIDTETEVNKSLSDAEIFEIFEEKSQKSVEIEDNLFENSDNFREEDSIKENSKLDSKVFEEKEEEGVNKSIHTEENLSSNQKSHNIVHDQDQEKDETETENTINPNKYFEEPMTEELEITKNESIAEKEGIEVDEYSQIFESEHQISTSNIPLVESNKDSINKDKDNDQQELEKSLNKSIAESEEENFSTIDSEIQEEIEKSDKSDIVVGNTEKYFLWKEEQQQIIEKDNDNDQTSEKSQNDSKLQKSEINDEIEKTPDSITEVEEYTQEFETEQEQGVTLPNKLLDDHELSLLIDENEEWFEDDLSNAADADKDILKKEAVKILSERMKVENEIRALELSANSPPVTSTSPLPMLNEILPIVSTSHNSRTSLSFSDGIIDKPPPPYFSISQCTSPESLSNSISLRSFMISCEESKVKELVTQYIDSIWDYWVKNKELPYSNDEEDELAADGAEAEKMNLSNASSNINYYEDRDREKEQEKDQEQDNDDLIIQKSPANVATTALQSLLKDLINETTHEILLVQTEYGKSFMDRIRVGPLALQAQKFRIPRAKNELISKVLQKVTEFIPELIWEHELVAATSRKKNLTKWSSRSRDIVDQLLAEELVIEDREFNETWPEEVIIMEKLQEKIVRMMIQDVQYTFTQAYF